MNAKRLSLSALRSTPWGNADQITHHGPDIAFVSTPSHGGFVIEQAKLEQMPEPYRSFKTFAGPGYYEEDCDQALIPCAFPERFTAAQVKDAAAAIVGYQRINPDYYGVAITAAAQALLEGV